MVMGIGLQGVLWLAARVAFTRITQFITSCDASTAESLKLSWQENWKGRCMVLQSAAKSHYLPLFLSNSRAMLQNYSSALVEIRVNLLCLNGLQGLMTKPCLGTR